MPQQANTPRGRMAPALALAVASYAVLQRSGPIVQGSEIETIPALAACFLALSGTVAAAEILNLFGGLFAWAEAKTPTGHKGSAAWVKSLRQIKKDLIQSGDGPYWGVHKGKPIYADYASNAVTFGPAGSGKGIGAVLPAIFANLSDKVLVDFKGELSCVAKDALEKRGERFLPLNLGGLYEDRLGQSASYNVLDVCIDNFERSGGLGDLTADLREMTKQLSPDPVKHSGGGENKYFLEGERDLIAYAIVQCILIDMREATLGHVYHLLNDVEALHTEALWVCGKLETNTEPSKAKQRQIMPIESLPWASNHSDSDVQAFAEYHRGTAAALCNLIEAPDSRTFNSFLTGARQALQPFNRTTRAAKILGRSSFRFSDCKNGDGTTTVSIIVDASRIEAQKPILGLVQWCAMTEMKRHKNKARPVYFICDEATNFKVHDLPTLLTWGRVYGIRLHLILQSISAFIEVYGERALNILLSETEIKQFLPGQREPRMLELIKRLLADQSVVIKDQSGNRNEGIGTSSYGYKEDAKPLMTEDEIRRTDRALLIIRGNKPLKTDLPSIASIAPWRDQLGVNPFYGKPYKLPVQLRIPRKHLRRQARS